MLNGFFYGYIFHKVLQKNRALRILHTLYYKTYPDSYPFATAKKSIFYSLSASIASDLYALFLDNFDTICL